MNLLPLLNQHAPTHVPVFETYWRFAAERYRLFYSRVNNQSPPWTTDPILQNYKFTNAFRACDLNYSNVINFPEDDFIVPGPGAERGIWKCFGNTPLPRTIRSQASLILEVVKDQDLYLSLVGEQPIRLTGKRPLSAIDRQNIFCECDKYARMAHPQVNQSDWPMNIKQTFRRSTQPLPAPFFPPKWGI